MPKRCRVRSLVIAELERRQPRTVGRVGGEHDDDLRSTVHGKVGRDAQLLVQTRHFGTDLPRDPDLLVQRDSERMQLVAELEPLLFPDVDEIVAVEQLPDEAVDGRKRQPGLIGDVLGRRPTACGNHFEDVEGARDRAGHAPQRSRMISHRLIRRTWPLSRSRWQSRQVDGALQPEEAR